MTLFPIENRTVKLKLDRTKDVFINVPKEAELVCDIYYTFETKPVWDSTSQRYRTFKLASMKTWVKQLDGQFKLEDWPDAFIQEIKGSKFKRESADLLVAKSRPHNTSKNGGYSSPCSEKKPHSQCACRKCSHTVSSQCLDERCSCCGISEKEVSGIHSLTSQESNIHGSN